MSTTASTVQIRQVLWSSASLGAVASHRLVFVAQLTTGHRLNIDGYTALR